MNNFSLTITASGWPWQPVPGHKGAGRFGGGWAFRLGITISQSLRDWVFDLGIGSIRVSIKQKRAS